MPSLFTVYAPLLGYLVVEYTMRGKKVQWESVALVGAIMAVWAMEDAGIDQVRNGLARAIYYVSLLLLIVEIVQSYINNEKQNLPMKLFFILMKPLFIVNGAQQ